MSYNDIKSRVNIDGTTDQVIKDSIESILQIIYDGSPLAASSINSWLSSHPSKNLTITYAFGATSTVNAVGGSGHIMFDPTAGDGVYYITETGQAVNSPAVVVLAHELGHATTGLEDNDTFLDPGGPNVALTNPWLVQLGYQPRASYEGLDESLIENKQYTNGATIKNAVVDIGQIYDNTAAGGVIYDPRNANLAALGMAGPSLIIGGSGDNTYTGTSDKNWIYGGGGADHLNGGSSNDHLYGGNGSDIFVGGSGDDEFWGGDDADESEVSGDVDTVDYSAGLSPIVISYNGSTATPSLIVSDGTGGTDTLHAIEKIVGTSGEDTLSFKGAIPSGYNLTIDANGGQPNGVADIVNAKGSTDLDGMDININPSTGDGYIKSNSGSGGQITLENFNTQVVGSFYDDTIHDGSSADKKIYGLDGNDTISVDSGNNVLLGGLGDDVINGGSGNDYISAGDGSNTVDGGDGDDYILTSTHSGFETVSGGAGNDYLAATSDLYPSEDPPMFGASIVLSGGTGDDVIDTVGSLGAQDANNFEDLHSMFSVAFGAGDGHDTILSNPDDGYNDGYDSTSLGGNEGHWNVSQIDMSTVSPSDVTYVWDVTGDPTLITPGSQDWPAFWSFGGDLAIRINSTGDTIFLGYVQGIASGIDGGEWQGYDWQPSDGSSGYILTAKTPTILFADSGSSTGGITFDIGGNADVYNVAPGEYAGPGRDPDESLSGTSGGDAITGGSGNDTISAGDGDDTITSSPGADQVDGGAGNDTFKIFEGLNDFSRSLVDGKLVLTSADGTEGVATLTGVESVYSVTDGTRYSVADMIGEFGTPNDDVIIGTDASDIITAGDGDDTITPKGGYDTIDGGNGTDQVIYAGNSTDYEISRETEDTIDVALYDGLNSKYDVLTNIESLYFSGDNTTILVSSIPPLESSDFGAGSQSNATAMTANAGLNAGEPALSRHLSGGPAHGQLFNTGKASAASDGLTEIQKAAAMFAEASARFGVNASASEWDNGGLEAVSQHRQFAFARPIHSLA